jgi:hypothetical protein
MDGFHGLGVWIVEAGSAVSRDGDFQRGYGLDQPGPGLRRIAPENSTQQFLVSEHGCTLGDYSREKKLPEDFLRGLGLRDVTYLDKPAVRIPYPDEEGQEVAVRFRVSLDGPEKFRWRSGDKPVPYGLKLLGEARKAGFVVLAEGESDCHTLWYHEVPALGIPGASNWRDGWAAYLDGIEKIYAVIEPDQGGDTLREKLTGCEAIRERLHLLELDKHKDPSALHLANSDGFRERFKGALEDAKQQITPGKFRILLRHLSLSPFLSAFATHLRIRDIAYLRAHSAPRQHPLRKLLVLH